MSRPKPKVLIEHTDKQTYKTEQVLASEGVWAVFYDSKPINLKNVQHADPVSRTQVQKSQLLQPRPCQKFGQEIKFTVQDRPIHSGIVDSRGTSVPSCSINHKSLNVF